MSDTGVVVDRFGHHPHRHSRCIDCPITDITGYKGSNDAMIAVMRGEVDGDVKPISSLKKYTKSGDLRIIATYTQRDGARGRADDDRQPRSRLDLAKFDLRRVIGGPPGMRAGHRRQARRKRSSKRRRTRPRCRNGRPAPVSSWSRSGARRGHGDDDRPVGLLRPIQGHCSRPAKPSGCGGRIGAGRCLMAVRLHGLRRLSSTPLSKSCRAAARSYCSVGVALGLCFGVIPGLGGTTALALLIPVTFSMEPSTRCIWPAA